MSQVHPIVPPVLAVLIVLGYAASLWWLLRCESMRTLLVLTILSCLSLSLRFFYTTDFPRGLYEDEPNILQAAMHSMRAGRLFGESSVLIPEFLSVLFQGQLAFLIGPNRWAMRAYSIATSVLATPAAFAAGRALGLRVVASMVPAALVAVLPPFMFYGRIILGGELVFHQLLMLAALARLIWVNGWWPEVAIGAFAQCLLLYDYWCGRAMLGMQLVAMVLARGRQRLLCLAVLVLALIGYVPYFNQRTTNMVRGVTDHIRPELMEHPLQDLQVRAVAVFKALVTPTANDGWGTIRAAAMHPPLILAVAALGVLLNPGRRGLFLLAGFLGGLAPAALSEGAPSAHRMLMAFAFVPLAAACALDTIRWRVVRVAAVVAVVLICSAQSLQLYFSPKFWGAESRWLFDWEKTGLVEALPAPPHPHFIVMQQVGFFFKPLALVDGDYDILDAANWYPANDRALTYVFEQHAAPLRGFYDSLLGYERVQSFGHAFMVDFPARDWSWLRQYGWTYEAHCDEKLWRGQVPTLLHFGLTFHALQCPKPVTHVWCGRWNGPPSTMQLTWNGAATVDTSTAGRVLEKTGFEKQAEFTVEPDAIVTVSITLQVGESFLAELFERTPAGVRLPPWERVSPYVEENAAPSESLQPAAPPRF